MNGYQIFQRIFNMRKLIILSSFLMFCLNIYSEETSLPDGDYEIFKKVVKKRYCNKTMEDHMYLIRNAHLAKDVDDRIGVSDAIEYILNSTKLSVDEKYSIVMDYTFNICWHSPDKTRFNQYFPYILKDYISDLRERLKKEEEGERYKTNECYRKSVILGLGYMGDMDVTEELIKMFDDTYWQFRESAVWAFYEGGHMKKYTKQEMKPYILKLNNDPYFEWGGNRGCLRWKNPPIDPKKCKIYPVRRAILPLLSYYDIKWRFDDSPCSNIGYGIRIIIGPEYIEDNK
jgi:hypothetical protein